MLVYCMNLKKLERYLRVNLLGPGPSSYKKDYLPGRGLTKVGKHCSSLLSLVTTSSKTLPYCGHYLKLLSLTNVCYSPTGGKP
jgi:hypothetical protein